MEEKTIKEDFNRRVNQFYESASSLIAYVRGDMCDAGELTSISDHMKLMIKSITDRELAKSQIEKTMTAMKGGKKW